MKQTAVEQFKQEFFGYADPYPYFSEEDKWVITERELLELLEKAKQMEKEQIENAYEIGRMRGMNFDEQIYYERNWSSNEQYYNETYKS